MYNPLWDNVQYAVQTKVVCIKRQEFGVLPPYVFSLRVGHCSSSSANDSPKADEKSLGCIAMVVKAGSAAREIDVAKLLLRATWLARLVAASIFTGGMTTQQRTEYFWQRQISVSISGKQN